MHSFSKQIALGPQLQLGVCCSIGSSGFGIHLVNGSPVKPSLQVQVGM